ncbi:MAG TPA: protein kinase [Polyangia bacterium]
MTGAREPAAPDVLGKRYRLDEPIGGGGTAIVYRARDLDRDTDVAVKELRPQFARLAPTRRRFLREATIVRQLDHDAIVRVLDSGEDGERAFIVMELIEGETLRRTLERLGGLGIEVARVLVMRLAEALSHAHQRGVVHRDLKPENVFLVGRPHRSVGDLAADLELATRIKLGDFGQARVMALASLTGTSMTWGTPEYMAPEMFARGRVDARSDLYSLGVLAHEVATGRLPWSRAEALARIGTSPTAPAKPLPAENSTPAWWQSLVGDLLAPTPELRPPGALVVYDRALRARIGERVPESRCFSCGAGLPVDLSRCLACGNPALRFGHTPHGTHRLILHTLEDDEATIAKMLDLIDTLATRSPRARHLATSLGKGPLPSDAPLLFLSGSSLLYSKEEKEAGIPLPAVLLDDLDEPTARGLERLFQSRGLDVEARARDKSPRSKLPGVKRVKPSMIAGGVASMSVLFGTFLSMTGSLLATSLIACGTGGVAGLFLLRGVRAFWRQPGHFRLKGHPVAVPGSDALLTEAAATLAKVRLPEARSLFADLSVSLYRLGRRAEERRNHALAADVVDDLLASMPPILERLATLATRLETLDDTLAEEREGELMQALGRLERRLATAPATEQANLARARERLERTFANRHVLEGERDRLTGTLCSVLARLRALGEEAEAFVDPRTRGSGDTGLAASLRALDGELHRAEIEGASGETIPATAPRTGS